MNSITEHFDLNNDLTLRDRTQSYLSLHAVYLAFTKYNNELIECRLTVKTTGELYQQINNEVSFNLKPEIRLSFSDKKFLSETNIEIEISLKPDLLSHLVEQSTNEDCDRVLIFCSVIIILLKLVAIACQNWRMRSRSLRELWLFGKLWECEAYAR